MTDAEIDARLAELVNNPTDDLMSVHLMDVDALPVPGLEGIPFALVVGDLSPRKNIDLLLDGLPYPNGLPDSSGPLRLF